MLRRVKNGENHRNNGIGWPDVWQLRQSMRLFSFLTFIASFSLLHAQGRQKIMNTDSGRVVLHYFTTGQLSTKEWMDKDDRWGKSWAYDRGGMEIFSCSTRKIGGHASVHFSYHGNGAISKAEVSDAPDGGIQWYRSTTTFDDQGNKTGFTEQGHDNDGIIPGPGVRVRTSPFVTVPPEQEVVEEQRLFMTNVFVVNASKDVCRMEAVAKQPSPALQGGQYTMAPGDTLFIGAYTTGEIYQEAAKHVTVTGKRWHKRPKKQKAYWILREDVVPEGAEARRYYVVIGR